MLANRAVDVDLYSFSWGCQMPPVERPRRLTGESRCHVTPVSRAARKQNAI